MSFSAPRWAPTRWLSRTGDDVPAEIRSALIDTLYGTLPIYAGGVINTVAVALLATLRHPSPAFLFWVALEVVVCGARLAVLVHDRRAAARGRATFTDLYIALSLCWAASVGYGTYVTIASGDWVSATLGCLSAAAMIGGICFRNFAAPRLVVGMILFSIGPCMAGAFVSREPMLLIILLQAPVYLVSMAIAAFKLNHMLVTTMQAERDNDHRARHDPLTGLANRTGLQHAFEARRAGGDQAIFYLDLNGFKAVNDRHGHAAGDQLLVAVAGRLRALEWPDLFVSRIGGDEFVLLAPALDEPSARRLSEAAVAAISDDPYPVEGARVPIGVSIGVALARAGDDLQPIMSSADKALYASKSAARAA